MELRAIGTGAYAAAKPEQPRAVMVVSADEYEGVWQRTVGRGAPPEVDFDTESVVILLAGPRNTGGWTIETKSVELDGGVLVVDAEIKGPPPDAIVTQAFTSPYAVIAVKTKALDSVRWDP